MRLIIAIIFTAVGFTVSAQNTLNISIESMSEIFGQISDKYLSAEQYSFDITYASYKGHQGNLLADKSKGTFYKSGNKIHSKMLGMETVQDDNIRVLKMDTEKLLFVFEPEPVQQSVDIEAYKTSLQRAVKITQQKLTSGDVYTIYFDEYAELEKMTIKVNPEKFISKVSLFYAKAQAWEAPDGSYKKSKPRLEITYSGISTQPVSNDLFKTGNYVLNNGTGFVAASNYKAYELNNMILPKQ